MFHLRLFELFALSFLVGAAAASFSTDQATARDIARLILASRERQESKEIFKSSVFSRKKTMKILVKMCTGGNTCCNINSRCGLGEGDCDSNVDCLVFPAAGKPLYEAQYSDFLRRKEPGLRKFWRNWRNCAKKLFAQIRRMRRRMRQICAKIFQR